MKGNDFIALASHLVANKAFGNAEARHRSAISRAYYGAFHPAVEFLEEVAKQRVPENHLGHQQAFQLLFRTGATQAMEAARALNYLRGERNKADYKLRVGGFDSQLNAQEKIELAVFVRTALEQCRIEPTRSAIIAALTASPNSDA